MTRITKSIATVLAAAAVMAPTASVVPAQDSGLTPSTQTQFAPPDRVDGLVAAQPAPRPVIAASGDAFDWTAAGVGFATAAGIALIGAGSLVTMRRHRPGDTLPS